MRLFVGLFPCCTITNWFQAEDQWNYIWLGQMPAAFKKLWFLGKIYDFQDDYIVSITCRTMNCRSVAPNCFVRKARWRKSVRLYACAPLPPNPAPFTPATCPQRCCYHHSPLPLQPPTKGFPPHPSLPAFCHCLSEETQASALPVVFSWHLPSCCWRDGSTASHFLPLPEGAAKCWWAFQ